MKKKGKDFLCSLQQGCMIPSGICIHGTKLPLKALCRFFRNECFLHNFCCKR